jgi:hypothetical protein
VGYFPPAHPADPAGLRDLARRATASRLKLENSAASTNTASPELAARFFVSNQKE